MAYIGWANNVNKIILSSTSVTVGEGATVTDNLEAGGLKKTRVSCANPADKYSVTMEFDFVNKDDNGLTELDRFYIWYKWSHCYGANPFMFPAILLNSNRQSGYSPESQNYDYEYYVIESAVDGNKSGLSQEVKMTWKTFATGPINIPDDTSAVDHITAENGCVTIFLTSTPSTEPSTATYPVSINDVAATITGMQYDGTTTLKYYFTPFTTTGTYTVTVNGKTASFQV